VPREAPVFRSAEARRACPGLLLVGLRAAKPPAADLLVARRAGCAARARAFRPVMPERGQAVARQADEQLAPLPSAPRRAGFRFARIPPAVQWPRYSGAAEKLAEPPPRHSMFPMTAPEEPRPHSAPPPLAFRPAISARADWGPRSPEAAVGLMELRQPLEVRMATWPAQESLARLPVLHSLVARLSVQGQSQAAPWPPPMLTARPASEVERAVARMRRPRVVPRWAAVAAQFRCVLAAERPRQPACLAALRLAWKAAEQTAAARMRRPAAL
jgi:hypothetical protein